MNLKWPHRSCDVCGKNCFQYNGWFRGDGELELQDRIRERVKYYHEVNGNILHIYCSALCSITHLESGYGA